MYTNCNTEYRTTCALYNTEYCATCALFNRILHSASCALLTKYRNSRDEQWPSLVYLVVPLSRLVSTLSKKTLPLHCSSQFHFLSLPGPCRWEFASAPRPRGCLEKEHLYCHMLSSGYFYWLLFLLLQFCSLLFLSVALLISRNKVYSSHYLSSPSRCDDLLRPDGDGLMNMMFPFLFLRICLLLREGTAARGNLACVVRVLTLACSFLTTDNIFGFLHFDQSRFSVTM